METGKQSAPPSSMAFTGRRGLAHSTYSGEISYEWYQRCLLRIACRRGGATRGPRAARALGWQRTIELTIAVEAPDRCDAITSRLATLLRFMTDDHWDLRFSVALRPSIQQILPRPEPVQPSEIALFSGGLDSVVGLYARALRGSSDFLAVSACGNEIRGRAQGKALHGLRSLGVRRQPSQARSPASSHRPRSCSNGVVAAEPAGCYSSRWELSRLPIWVYQASASTKPASDV